MQEYILPYVCTAFALFFIRSVGAYFITKLDKNGLMRGHELVVGFALTTLFLSLYFIFPINFTVLGYIYLGAALITVRHVLWKNVNNSNTPKIILLVEAIPLFVFLLYAAIYGSNFITFRGNIWDWFNYNTMAVGYSKYNVKDFQNLIEAGNPIAYIAHLNLSQRPFVVAIPSAILSIIKTDNFSLMYFYKALLLTLLLRSLIQCLLDIGYSKAFSMIISLCIIFSSWFLYLIEIDALSNLAFVSFIPFLFSILSRSNNLSGNIPIVLLSLIFAAYFCIYPEYAVICYGVLLLVLFGNYRNLSSEMKLAFKKKIALVLFISLLVLSVHWESSVNFLIRQIIGGFTTKVDWWGYYGGYLFGPNSPVVNPDIVSQVRSEVAKVPNLFTSGVLINILMGNLLYVLPSIFGLFHILAIEYAEIPALVISGTVGCAYIYTLLRGTKKHLWLKMNSLAIILLIIILLIKGSFWGAVKGLTFLMSLIPLTLAVALYEINKNIVRISIAATFLLSPLFLVYKYSEYNGGIGKYDGFPSVLKKESKLNFNWDIEVTSYLKCKIINVATPDPFFRHFIVLNLENFGLPYQTNYPLLESYGYGKLISEPRGISSDYDCQIE